jgi:hypothetical protein
MKTKELSSQDIELIVKLIKKQEEKYAGLVAEIEKIRSLGFSPNGKYGSGYNPQRLYALEERLDKIRVNLQKVVSNPINDLSDLDIETTLNILTVGQMNYEDWIKRNRLIGERKNYFNNLIKETKKMVKKLTNYLNERKAIEKEQK